MLDNAASGLFSDLLFGYTPSVSSVSKTRRVAITLLVGDLVGATLFLLLQSGFYFGPGDSFFSFFGVESLGAIAIFLFSLYIAGAYRSDPQRGWTWASRRTLTSCLMVGVPLMTLSYLFYGKIFSVFSFFIWRSNLLPILSFLTVWTIALRLFVGKWSKLNAEGISCLFIGAEATGQQFEQDFLKSNSLSKLMVLSSDLDIKHQLFSHIKYLKQKLKSFPRRNDFTALGGIIVAPEMELSGAIVQQLMQLRLIGVPVYRLPDFYELLWQKLPSRLLQDSGLAFDDGFHLLTNRANLKLKRLIDLCAASLLLLLLSPVMAVTALAIRLESPGPIFYSQLRNAQNAKPIRVYKFRSMYQDAEKQGAQWAQERDPRVTRIGYWLRLARIDELPQLWNVLRGDMSLIGPRPERPEFDGKLEAEIPYYMLRYLVKPGITGWAQVCYPYGASVEDAYEKLSYDLYYIKNYSIWLDFAIALKTVQVVLLGKGR